MGRNKSTHQLPFKVGQEAESKSFTEGYRSAWFRCKIKNITTKKGNAGYSLQFFDFPDEKVEWTKLYQKPARHFNSDDNTDTELMVRPSFPPFFRESECPDSYPDSDVVAIVEDDWAVGDLVDWWTDSCYWSGKVTQLLGNDKVKIELPKPPIGEGSCYEAYCKDLRPSLNWTPEDGWTVPISREHGSSKYCARLVQPPEQDEERDEDTFMENPADGHAEGNDILNVVKLDSTKEEMLCPDASSSRERNNSSLRKLSSRVGRYGALNVQEEVWSRKNKHLTSLRHLDTVESAVMELEELANKIRWFKGLLQFGFRWSNAMKPSWKILETGGSHLKR